jgi:hypothetical protein
LSRHQRRDLGGRVSARSCREHVQQGAGPSRSSGRRAPAAWMADQ